MKEIWFLSFNGCFYLKIGRMTSYFTPYYVKRNQRRFSLADKHRMFANGSFKYLYSYI